MAKVTDTIEEETMTRMRLLAAGLALTAAALLSIGCSPQQEQRDQKPTEEKPTEQTPTGQAPEETPTDEAQGRAEKLWTQIKDDDYRTWGRAPGYEKRQPAKGPHGDEVEIFVDPTAEQALKGGSIQALPVGSIIVKDGYDTGSVESVSVMQKVDGGWYWAEYSPEGEVKVDGVQQPACAGCHKAGEDFVRSFKLSK